MTRGRLAVMRERREDGTALVEFTFLAVLVMVPVVYVLLTVAQVQAAAFGVTEAARQAGRAYVTAAGPSAGQERARAAAVLALQDQGVEGAAGVLPQVTCPPRPAARCLEPGTRVVVTVRQVVPLRWLGALFAAGREPGIPVTATHVTYVDRLVERP